MGRFINPVTQPNDDKGRSEPNSRLYFFEQGSTTPKSTYFDSDLTVPNTHPVEADGAGRFPDMWLEAGGYRVEFRDKNDVLIWERDEVDEASSQFVFSLGSAVAADSIADLLSKPTVADNSQATVKSYYDNQDFGGGLFYFDADQPKTNHNGGTVISVTVPFSGNQSDVGDFLNGVGETDPLGNGCWVKVFDGDSRANVTNFGAIGNGSIDDSDSMFAFWKYCLAGAQVFDISGGYNFKIVGVNYSDSGVNSYFQTEQNDNIEVKFGNSRIFIDPPSAQGQSNLFDVKQTQGFKFDNINFEVDSTKAAAGDVSRTLIIRHGDSGGSSDIRGNSITVKNSEGLLITSDQGDYQANGFDSVFRSRDITIGSININNEAMPFTFANEFTGYAIVCQFSGDNTSVQNIVVNNIHRALFLYGVRDFTLDSGCFTQSNATTVNLSAFGSVENIKIRATIVQNDNLATQLTRIQPNELGTSNGSSVDILGGRPHYSKDIDLDFYQYGSLSSLDAGFDMNKTTGDGSDSDFRFENISLKINSLFPGISRSIILFTEARSQNSSNMSAENIVVSNSYAASNSRVSLIENMNGNMVVKDSTFDGNLICQYGSNASTDAPNQNFIVLDNTNVRLTVTENGSRDVPIYAVNSNINTAVAASELVPAQNKIFENTTLGGKLIASKPQFGTYTNFSDSSAMYAPDNPVKNLVAGNDAFGNNATPKIVDLTTTSDLKTDTASKVYHDYFFRNSEVGRTTTNAVDIYAQPNGTSDYALARGYLISSGLSSRDFTSGDFALKIFDVTNSGGGSSYVPGDFTLTVVDANTLRFQCTAGAVDMCVTIYDL